MAVMVRRARPGDNPTKVGFSGGPPRVTLSPMGQRERVRTRCRERLAALTEARLDPDEARHAAVAELRQAVGFDRWCWPLSDPDSALSTGGMGEVDFWPALARLVALEHGGDVTSKPQLVAGRRASVALSAATSGKLARSRRWRECLRPYGIGDELMTACRDRHGCWGSVELMRDSADAPFDEADTRLLDAVAPTLGTLLRRSLVESWQTDLGEAEAHPPGTLVVDSDLRPTSWTRPFREWLAELPPSGPDPETLPPAVYEIAARSLVPPDAAVALPNRVRIRTLSGRWCVIEGAPLEGANPGQVAVTVRAATSEEIFDVLCKVHDFTRRERQLVALMLHGRSTVQLAEALYISPYTVKDHLKAIFDKTGVRSRRELLSHLAGRVPMPDAEPRTA
jgi:DNA-binding CsgD family transcriptional regulator